MIGIGIDDLLLMVVGLMAVAICLYLISFKDGDMAMPYRIPGLFITAVLMFISATVYLDYLKADAYNIVYIALCLVAVAVTGAFTLREAKDKYSLGYIAIVAVFYAMFITSLYAMGDKFNDDIADAFTIILKLPAFAGFVVMMISGAREKKLIPINLGFVGTAGLVMVVISQSGFSMLGNGIMLLVFGGILLAINFKISKAKQKTPAIENNEEVEDNE